jgi:hypothetical protein
MGKVAGMLPSTMQLPFKYEIEKCKNTSEALYKTVRNKGIFHGPIVFGSA